MNLPEGWKLVPVEPTPEMKGNAAKWARDGFNWPATIYRAMIKAAPPAPATDNLIYIVSALLRDYHENRSVEQTEKAAKLLIETVLGAAPTPPAQEDAPVAWCRTERDCCDEYFTAYRDDETPPEGKGWEPLYTRPADDKLRKAAEKAEMSLEALFHMINNFEIDPETLATNIAATIDNLRAALEETTTPSNTDKQYPD